MRPVWTGSISFGLVNIPVKMYPATRSNTLDLDMLDSKDLSKIRFVRVNEKTGREVKWEEIVKGYKLPNDDYVVLTDKDFEQAAAKKDKLIEITEFTDPGEIDPIYYETPYYLAPDKNGQRAYVLLKEALLKTGKVGVALFVMRSKETLAVLKAKEDAIVLNRIRFEEEIRNTKELELPSKSKVKPAELKMAINLIDELSGKFDISQYKDTYTGELMKLVKSRAKGTKYRRPKLRLVHSKSDDLMDQLKASLKQKKAS
ncbi:MAG TPA: Ku protein [Thermodesulfobacteriota bacterium]|nr:Ku protein [Thermodesulfobacteriota bacterium]